jgi:RNA polymerase sigma factor (sigma-70 family)
MSEEQPSLVQITLLYHFCRLRIPDLRMGLPPFQRHLLRVFALSRPKRLKKHEDTGWAAFLEGLQVLDCYLACACLDGQPRAWELLFAARASRSDALLVDALRARAVRLFPRDENRQEQAVAEFWGYLLAGERDGAVPILARYDGQRPLIPWLIRVFQNKHLSDLRPGHQALPLPEEIDDPNGTLPVDANERWHEEFRQAAREWMADLDDNQIVLLGLRLRYRMSQRGVADLLGIHEGNVSRRTDRLREHCLDRIGRRMQELGWTGEDLGAYILKEMDSLLLDEPRLSADRLAALLAAHGLRVPLAASERHSE